MVRGMETVVEDKNQVLKHRKEMVADARRLVESLELEVVMAEGEVRDAEESLEHGREALAATVKDLDQKKDDTS